jgi:hypothetical protein
MKPMGNNVWVLHNPEYLFIKKMKTRHTSQSRKIRFTPVDYESGDYERVNIWSYGVDPSVEAWTYISLNSHGFAGLDSDRAVMTVSVKKAREIWNELRKMGYDQDR